MMERFISWDAQLMVWPSGQERASTGLRFRSHYLRSL